MKDVKFKALSREIGLIVCYIFRGVGLIVCYIYDVNPPHTLNIGGLRKSTIYNKNSPRIL